MKKYVEAEIEIVKFDAEDTIVTSCAGGDSCDLDD